MKKYAVISMVAGSLLTLSAPYNVALADTTDTLHTEKLSQIGNEDLGIQGDIQDKATRNSTYGKYGTHGTRGPRGTRSYGTNGSTWGNRP